MTTPRLRLHLWPEPYVVARLDSVPSLDAALRPEASPVCVIVGHEEVSLLAPEPLLAEFGIVATEVSPGWRALTLDVVLPLEIVGVLAAVSDALARIGVPLMAFSSHDTDHFLVPHKDLGRVLAALNQVNLERFIASL